MEKDHVELVLASLEIYLDWNMRGSHCASIRYPAIRIGFVTCSIVIICHNLIVGRGYHGNQQFDIL